MPSPLTKGSSLVSDCGAGGDGGDGGNGGNGVGRVVEPQFLTAWVHPLITRLLPAAQRTTDQHEFCDFCKVNHHL